MNVILSVSDVNNYKKNLSLSFSLFLWWREMWCGELGVSFITAECSSEGFKSGVALNREGFWTNQIVVHVVVVFVVRRPSSPRHPSRSFPSVYASTKRRLDINSLAADKPFLKWRSKGIIHGGSLLGLVSPPQRNGRPFSNNAFEVLCFSAKWRTLHRDFHPYADRLTLRCISIGLRACRCGWPWRTGCSGNKK